MHIRARKGSALVLVLVLTMGLAALAMSAIYLSSHAQLISKSFEREADYAFAADAGIAMGRSRLDVDPGALPDSGYTTLLDDQAIQDADNVDVPNVRMSVWVGPTGVVGSNGQRFASIVAEARDGNGSRFIRHLEVTRESFAKYAYFSNYEHRADGSVIVFGGGDVLNGPVWSNDTIQILSGGSPSATFNDSVGTAQVVTNRSSAVFAYPPVERMRRIELPSTSSLGILRTQARIGGFELTGLQGGTSSTAGVRARIEFVNVDLNGDGDAIDADEGFFRVYESADTASGTATTQFKKYTSAGWLRGDTISRGLATPDLENIDNCGDYHWDNTLSRMVFFPASAHDTTGWGAIPATAGAVGDTGRLISGTASNPNPPTGTPTSGFRNRWFYDWLVANEIGANRRFGQDALGVIMARKRILAHMAATYTPGSGPKKFALDSILGPPPSTYRNNLNTAVALTGSQVPPAPRCYLGGDPHLASVERNIARGVNTASPSAFPYSNTAPPAAGRPIAYQVGGDDSTFSAVGSRGKWRAWTGTVDPRLTARRPWDANYLFPLSKLINTSSRGVIYTDASVGVSGTVRGRVTLHSAGNVVFLDDIVYATDPSSATRNCADILGIVTNTNAEVAANAVFWPSNLLAYRGGTQWRPMTPSVGTTIHAIVMTLNTSFQVENYAMPPNGSDAGTTSGVLTCNSANVGRGCLKLWGGLIQERRGPVGQTSGTGYQKNYGYDICGASNPPPYFPTTGRFAENRYTEIDPVGFDIERFFELHSPAREP